MRSSTRNLIRVLLGLSLAAAMCWPLPAVDPLEHRMTGPLKRAGVDVRDEAALIRVLAARDSDLQLAFSAAYALGNLPTSPTLIRELNLAALADDEILMNYAIRSLLKHGDREWVPSAAARLPNVRDRRQRIHLAGELAQAGRFDGWDMVEAAIVSGELWQRETALFEVANFRGMKDASGKPVDLLAKLDELRRRVSDDEARADIARVIVRIGVADFPAWKRKGQKQ